LKITVLADRFTYAQLVFAGRAALSITTKSHKDRYSKNMMGQGIPRCG
jgi:hypothetical protein